MDPSSLVSSASDGDEKEEGNEELDPSSLVSSLTEDAGDDEEEEEEAGEDEEEEEEEEDDEDDDEDMFEFGTETEEEDGLDTEGEAEGEGEEEKEPYEVVMAAPASPSNANMLDSIQPFPEENDTSLAIYDDDTIAMVRLKISKRLSFQLPIEEMYLFTYVSEVVSLPSVYQQLTLRGQVTLTVLRFKQWLLNIFEKDPQTNEMKSLAPIADKLFSPSPAAEGEREEKGEANGMNSKTVSYDDLMRTGLDQRRVWMSRQLGHPSSVEQKELPTGKGAGSGSGSQFEYPFIANPFYVDAFDTQLERQRKLNSTWNNQLVFQTGNMDGRRIYVCPASAVLNHFATRNQSLPFAVQLYFPLLAVQTVSSNMRMETRVPLSADAYLRTHAENVERSRQMWTSAAERYIRNVDLFYRMYATRKAHSDKFTPLPNASGVLHFKFAIHTRIQVHIPVDIVFKLVHATHATPFVKYNQDHKQEPMVRLYCPRTSIDGRPIPSLSKAVINKLIRGAGRTPPCVAMYVPISRQGKTVHLVCEINDECTLFVYTLEEMNAPIAGADGFGRDAEGFAGAAAANVWVRDLEDLIQSAMRPFTEQIQPYFEQGGLQLEPFTSLMDARVETVQLQYRFAYQITDDLKLKDRVGCISSIFSVEQSTLRQSQLRFKRVANFNKMDGQDAFVLEKITQGHSLEEIVEELKRNFGDLNDDSAHEIVARLHSELEVSKGQSRRRHQIARANPGFATVIEVDTVTSNAYITVSGINHLRYLQSLEVYVDGLMRITQDPASTQVPESQIRELCARAEVDDFEPISANAMLDASVVAAEKAEKEWGRDESADRATFFNQSPYQYDYGAQGNANMDELFDILDFNNENEDDEDEDAVQRGGADEGQGADMEQEIDLDPERNPYVATRGGGGRAKRGHRHSKK